VNRSNIKLNIKTYSISSQKKKTGDGSDKKAGMWNSCAQDIKNIISYEYTIVYMDFRHDVQLMCKELEELFGEKDVRPYYGKGMPLQTKKKTDSD
jgi:hypothetical protein